MGIPAARDVAAPNAQVRLVVRDDLVRSRLTVGFRFFLALPHLLLLSLWASFALLFAVVNWFAILFTGRPVEGLHRLQCQFVRYFTHVDAYFNLLAEPWPPVAAEREYAIDLEVPPAGPQSRWKTGFRLVLAVPAVLLGVLLGASGSQAGSDTPISPGVISTVAFLAWFVCLLRGRMPQGLRDLGVYSLDYSAQVGAYLLLVTDRYPDSDPLAVRYPRPGPDHPVRIAVADDLRRSRLTVFFRLLLWLPHLVWLLLWGVAALLAAVANWFVTLFAGRPASGLHRFLAAYARYSIHTTAFLYLVANPFPGFTGAAGGYPVDLEIGPPERQNRWTTGFRLILAIPAVIIGSALGNALMLVALFGWFAGLVRGEMPRGLRNLGVFGLRYQGQITAYAFLLTERYPFSGPSQEMAAPAPAQAPPPPAAPASVAA